MTDKPTLQELLEVQDFYDLPSPALVEKDWYVVKALAAITVIDTSPFKLVFGGGTGSRQHFDQLDQRLRDKVLAAAAQYYQTTGQKLKINSAYRSADEQARVDSGGRPKAEPGKSLHQSGLAVDIQNYMDPAALQALKAQGLYQRVPNDPVHFEMAYGGIVSGPKSGYRGMLHGDEAVIPLAGGRSVPVEMPAFTGSLQEQIGLLSDNNSLLSELIGLMSNNNSISSKILQASRG